MKIYPGKCKVCGKTLRLEIADGYDVEHDPQKLFVYATCNPCFDLMIERRKIHDLVARLCRVVDVLNPKGALNKKKVPDELMEALLRAAKAFSAWCAKLLRRQHAANVGSLAARLAGQPRNWLGVLRDFENESNES